VILAIFVEFGQISPLSGIANWRDAVLGTIPLHIIMFVFLALVILFPGIAVCGRRNWSARLAIEKPLPPTGLAIQRSFRRARHMAAQAWLG